MGFEQEVMVIYAGTQRPAKDQPGYLDDVPINRLAEFQNSFLTYVDSSVPELRKNLVQKKELTAEIEAQLKQALSDFKSKVWKK
jgi:F-type H+-transporting ATPase subunit alpha